MTTDLGMDLWQAQTQTYLQTWTKEIPTETPTNISADMLLACQQTHIGDCRHSHQYAELAISHVISTIRATSVPQDAKITQEIPICEYVSTIRVCKQI